MLVDMCLSEGNRDRTFWITDPLVEANEQQANGVRMVCFIRGYVRMSQITKAPGFCRYWKRTTWIRKRGDDEWILLEDTVTALLRIMDRCGHLPSTGRRGPPRVHECCSRGAWF